MADSISKPLVVDLDGSLIKTDLLFESFVKAFYSKPWIIFVIPFWLMAGKSRLKKELYLLADLNTEYLPWNDDLIKYLAVQSNAGREIILCTGSWYELAKKVADQFSFFSAAYGTDDHINLTGSAKASFLKELYGEKQFSYVGNETRDLDVWRISESAVVVGTSDSLRRRVEGLCQIEKSITDEKSFLKILLNQMRVHQWVKNGLLFVPLITSHQATNIELLSFAVLAFIAYCLCASATYILNDLLDLESDRRHAKKRFRPLASGNLSIPLGVAISATLLSTSFIISLWLPVWFIASLALYVVITLSYSFKLKRLQTLDITVLASLYTLRIFSGAVAVGIWPSFWLLAFSMFVFLCLAIVKRLSEIINSKGAYSENEKISGRGYFISDLPILMSLATSSGIISILVFAMYINSSEIMALYNRPYALWLICPLFGYWIIRVLIIASRGEMDEDPIVFAIKDWRSWLTGAMILAIVSASSI